MRLGNINKSSLVDYFISSSKHNESMTKTAVCGWSSRGSTFCIAKPLLVMKLTVFLLTVAFLNVAAKGISQKVNFTGKNASLEEIFLVVKQQTGYLFLYQENTLTKAKPVTIVANNQPLLDFLNNIFKDQPLKYVIESKTINVYPVVATSPGLGNLKTGTGRSLFTLNSFPPVKGIIRGPNGQPLANVNIVIKGTKRGTTSAADGSFSLEAKQGETLVITSIGFSEKNIAVGPGEQLGVITLEISGSLLDETQVIAYGKTSQRLSTGNITSVGAKDIAKQPVVNPLLALQGRVPGMVIQQATGNPGAGIKVLIQGRNTLSSGTDPLYVIDGMPYTSQLIQDGLGAGGAGNSSQIGFLGNGSLWGNGNPLNYINPTDIESITILKDAEATSIYGSRAANGAVLITMKKGKAGQTRVDINANTGFSRVPHFVKMMSTAEYLNVRRQAFANDGLTPGEFDYDLNGTWDTARSVNWQKEMINGTAKYSNLNVSVSGGNENTQFMVSSTYNLQGTVQYDPKNEFKDRKGTLFFSLSNTSPNRRFKIQLNGSYMIDNNHLPRADLTFNAVKLPPLFPKLLNSDGSLNWGSETNPGYVISNNPFAEQKRYYTNKTYHLNSTLNVSYEILKDIDFKTRLGYDNLQSNKWEATPFTSLNPVAIANGDQPNAIYANSNINGWLIEPSINYKKSLNKATIEAFIGGSANQQNSVNNSLWGIGYMRDDQLNNMNNAANIYTAGGLNIVYKSIAAISRLNFNWDNKYLVNLNVRRDGSSRFGSANLFHNFGSASAAWIFSEENFIQKSLRFLSFGKLKVSYGAAGNDQIGDYAYLTLYTIVNDGTPYQGLPMIYPTKIPNPYYGWEITRKLNVGTDLGMFKNKVVLSVNYQVNRTSQLLTSMKLPSITGAEFVKGNLPAVIQNSSLEISLNTVNVTGESFEWESRLNMTVARNKLVSFPGLANSAYSNIFVIGQPTSVMRLYHCLGVDEESGLFLFETADGKTTTAPNYQTDMTILKSVEPKFYGGLENSLRYKGVSLSFLLQFTKKIAPRPFFALESTYGFPVNMPAYLQGQFWQKPGDKAEYPKLTTTFNNSGNFYSGITSDYGYVDASFLRFTNVSLSWKIPAAWLRSIKMKDVSVYTLAQNLLTITKYKGLDPETTLNTSVPILRTITFGLKLGL